MSDEVTEIRLVDGQFEVVVDPRSGGRVRSLSVRGVELLVTDGDGPLSWGIYPMVPYAGRVRHAELLYEGRRHALRPNSPPHSIHGTVFDAPWVVEGRTERSVTMSTPLGPHWPFGGTVVQHIVTTDRSVKCELALTCTSDSMPAQVGWHPWFRKPADVRLDFASMLQRDPEGITTAVRVPVGTGPLDDCLVEPSRWPRVTIDGIAVEIASNCDYWVVYDESDAGSCIEPQSGPPNGVNDDALVLHHGDTLMRWMEIRLV